MYRKFFPKASDVRVSCEHSMDICRDLVKALADERNLGFGGRLPELVDFHIDHVTLSPRVSD
jgi:hypothetical protein